MPPQLRHLHGPPLQDAMADILATADRLRSESLSATEIASLAEAVKGNRAAARQFIQQGRFQDAVNVLNSVHASCVQLEGVLAARTAASDAPAWMPVLATSTHVLNIGVYACCL